MEAEAASRGVDSEGSRAGSLVSLNTSRLTPLSSQFNSCSRYFFVYCMLFMTWSLIHYGLGVGDGTGNKYIYSSLDWNNTSSTSTLVFIILLFVVPVCNCFFWAVVANCRDSAPVDVIEPQLQPADLEQLSTASTSNA